MSNYSIVGLAGAVIIIASCFLPWGSFMGLPLVGTDGPDGMIMMAIAALIGGAVLLKRRWAWIVGIVLSLFALGKFIQLYVVLTDLPGGSLEAGAMMMMAGALLGVIGCAWGLRASQAGAQP